MRILRDLGANVNTTNEDGDTALHYRVFQEDEKMVKILVWEFDVNLFIMNKKGEDVYDIARETRNPKEFLDIFKGTLA
jgi:ankyrin repeat protein